MTASPRKHVLDGRRILIVEDELLVAMELRQTLRGWGCEVLGPVSSAARALAMLDGEMADAVLLDLNLKGQSAAPLGAELVARNLPFVVVTGYGARMANDPALRSAPRVEKPLEARKLEAALIGLLGSGSGET